MLLPFNVGTPPRTERRATLRDYPGVPHALKRELLAVVNRGYTPEQWRAEQARRKGAALKAEAASAQGA